MPKVACPPHQVYHKNSKKCVNIGSDEFQKILEKDLFAFNAYSKKIDKFLATQSNAPKCPENKVYNKYTKRCVTINSQSYFKALKDHPDVFDDQKDKISKMVITKIKKTTNPKLLIKKPVVAPSTKTTNLLKKLPSINTYYANLAKLPPRNRYYADKAKLPPRNRYYADKAKMTPVNKNTVVPALKNIKKAKNVFGKLISKKIQNVPSKYLKKQVLKINTFGDHRIDSMRKLIYSLPYREYSPNDIFKKKIPATRSVNMSYTVPSSDERYYKDVLKIDPTKHVLDLKWYHECQKYIDTLSAKEKWALRGYSYKGDVYVNLTERKMKIDFKNFSLVPFVYEFFQMVLDGRFPHKDFDKKDIDQYLKDGDVNKLNQLSEKFYKLKLDVNVKKELVSRLNNTLTNVIKRAPPVTSTMTVFRGVKDSFFTKSDYKNNKVNEVYLNKGYVSTSMSWNQSLNSFSGSACCFSVITILPGTRCLPLLGLSKFSQEMEILLNKDTKFLVRRKFIAPKPNNSYSKMKFSHIIVT